MRSSAALLTAAVALAAPTSAGAADTTRVSVANGGGEPNADAYSAAVSADGRFVAFVSKASNLVRGDTNGRNDIFVRDTRNGRTERVSLNWRGRQISAHSLEPAISGDGRHVAFVSRGSKVVRGDNNRAPDVFVRDRRARRTTRVTVSSSGREGGRYDQSTPYGADSGSPVISGNGRFVAFSSIAVGLVRGDTNSDYDMFVHDRRTGRTRRESVTPSGGQSCCWYSHPESLSPDGRYLAFSSGARNLVPDDTGNHDAFVRDRRQRKTTKVSVTPAGRRARGPSYGGFVSQDGRFVAFSSEATDLVAGDTNRRLDVFWRDLRSGTTRRISTGLNGEQLAYETRLAGLSRDGLRILIQTEAPNVVAGDTNGAEDAFLHDIAAGTTTRISVADDGTQPPRGSSAQGLSANGLFALFSSSDPLTGGDTNRQFDVFLRGPLP